MKIKKIDISEVEGFRLGNAENAEAGTGVTVIIADEGAVAGVDVRGGGPATRETDLLRSENTVDKVHAVVLSGGSAFGLEAASGVMRALAEKGIGFRIDENIVVPIVPGASLYDLTVGRSDVFPDVAMGREAAENAFSGKFESGNHGAGTGATVGKYLGYERAMKTGLGTFACGDDFIQVGAIAAVNAVGDIYNGAGNIIAGLRTSDGSAIKGTIRVLKGLVHDESSPDLDLTDIRTIASAEAVRNSVSPAVSHTETVKEAPVSVSASDETESADEKDDIVKAMMRSYEQEQAASLEVQAEPEASSVQTEPEEIAPAPVFTQEIPSEPQEESQDTEDFNIDDYLQPAEAYAPAEPEAAEPASEHVYADIVPAAAYEEAVHAIPETQEQEDVSEVYAEQPEVIEPEEAEPAVSEPEVTEPEIGEEDQTEPAAASEEPEDDDDDGYILTEADKADMGYDIPFNTTISCVITNAVLTKSQANKLASILHDAYARAVKPVHGTLDGDTIFVMSTCKQKVNFDAFAALATDVLQYAVIDGAASAEGAYGLPAAKDIIRK